MSEYTREEANARIAELLKIVENAIRECENLADEFGLTFMSPIDVYGMGGTYDGNWRNDTNEWGDPKEDGWYPSSQSC